MANFRIAEFIDNNANVFYVEEKLFVKVEFLKIFTRHKPTWNPIKGQPENGFASINEANNFIQEYKKTLPKYHYIK